MAAVSYCSYYCNYELVTQRQVKAAWLAGCCWAADAGPLFDRNSYDVMLVYVFWCFWSYWERPHHDDSTASRSLCEVKHHRAQLVLRWGTTLESWVLFFCSFCFFILEGYRRLPSLFPLCFFLSFVVIKVFVGLARLNPPFLGFLSWEIGVWIPVVALVLRDGIHLQL